MNVLQLCNNYCGSKVHAELSRELDSQDVRQTDFEYFRWRNIAKEYVNLYHKIVNL